MPYAPEGATGDLKKCMLRWKEHRLRVLRRLFDSKEGELIGDWRELQSEELHNLYSLPNIMGLIKGRRMRLAGHVAYMG
jgi:hypothetical protein